MNNIKHTVVGLLTIGMIGTLSYKQVLDIKDSNRIASLLNDNKEASTYLTYDSIRLSDTDVAQILDETYTQEELLTLQSKKSVFQSAYVLLTQGTLNVYTSPSENSPVCDNLNAATQVQITESTDGFYKIFYNQGKTGYVLKEFITESKAEADYAAMHYDNYKKGKINTDGSSVKILRSAKSNSSTVGTLENGAELVLLYDENGYTKVYYGDDMNTGFVSSSSIELTNQWISKSEVASIQKIAAEKKEAAAKAAAEKESKERSGSYVTPESSSRGQAIVNEAKKYLGVKYVYGGTSPKGFDCSGLVQYVCKSVGISVSRTSASQFSNGKAVNKSDLEPGDLLFFAKGGRINHVGIYAGNDQMIHAPRTGDVVKYESINSAYRKNGYVGARRVY